MRPRAPRCPGCCWSPACGRCHALHAPRGSCSRHSPDPPNRQGRPLSSLFLVASLMSSTPERSLGLRREGGLPIAGGETAGLVCPAGRTCAQIHKGGSAGGIRYNPVFTTHAASSCRLGAGYSFWVIDSRSLRPSEDLYKSFSVCSKDRKYFSGASGIKIADKEHPFSLGLGDMEIGAVKHSPFDMIPQVIQRGEDDSKCPPFGHA